MGSCENSRWIQPCYQWFHPGFLGDITACEEKSRMIWLNFKPRKFKAEIRFGSLPFQMDLLFEDSLAGVF